MLKIRKKSGWSWVTSSSIGVSVEIIAAVGAGKGSITLKSPTGIPTKFHYSYAGAGFGVGAKFSLGGSTEEFVSAGVLYMTESFRGSELEAKNIAGGCLIAELSAGVIHGGSGSGMLLGMDLKDMQNEFRSDIGQLLIAAGTGNLGLDIVEHMGWFRSSAKAVLFMGGTTQGANIGAAAMGNVGYLWQGAAKSVGDPVIDDIPSSIPNINMPIRRTTQVSSFIEISSDVLFDFDKFNIKPAGEQELMRVGYKLRLYPNKHILVQGYTDNIGNAGYNVLLSEHRAEAVKNWFVTRQYVKGNNISTKGFGLTHPVAPNSNPTGRAKNRRIEIAIMPD